MLAPLIRLLSSRPKPRFAAEWRDLGFSQAASILPGSIPIPKPSITARMSTEPSHLINEVQGRSFFTSGAKARDFIKLFGTAAAVPLRKTTYKIASTSSKRHVINFSQRLFEITVEPIHPYLNLRIRNVCRSDR